MKIVTTDFVYPNGLCFSPDEKILYVNCTRERLIRAYDMKPDGSVGPARLFHQYTHPDRGNPDGIKCDVEGNVYCGGAGGLWIMDPQGKKLGRIVHGAPATTNLAFGGDDWKTLYFTSRNHLGSVNVKAPGIPVPARKT